PCAGAVQIIRRGKVFAPHDPIEHCPRRGRCHGTTLTDPFGKASVAMHRYGMKAFAVIRPQIAMGRLAKAGRLPQYHVEHWCEVAGRGVDDPQHLGGRGLLHRASRVSVMRRAFSIAMTACAAKFFSSAICLSENGFTSRRWALRYPNRTPSLRIGT